MAGLFIVKSNLILSLEKVLNKLELLIKLANFMQTEELKTNKNKMEQKKKVKSKLPLISEKQLHKQICDYLHLQYPKVIFNTDMAGIKLTIGQATQAKKLRSSNSFPDIVIYEQSTETTPFPFDNIEYHALFLEVKKENPYRVTKQEVLKKFKPQADMMLELRKRGYKAEFTWKFTQAKNIIDTYLRK